MKTQIKISAVIFFLCTVLTIGQVKQLQAIKNESSITYQLTHPLHEIESTSKDSYCVIEADISKKEIKKVTVQVDVMTFNSGNSNRDSHAMEVVESIFYPDARFTSTNVWNKGDSLKVQGKLIFHGVTRDVIISTLPKWSEKQLIVNGSFDVSLTAFKIERPSLLMIPVKDDLRFTLTQSFNL